VIHVDVLPPAQRAFWEKDLTALPTGWVLYGGTAIALHLGHRQSHDFDFFSSNELDRTALKRSCRLVADAKTLQDEPNTLTLVAETAGAPIKLSFFGGIDFGRVGDPVRVNNVARIASRLDLLGTKLATVTQRIESRDYVDIAALLTSGLTINEGVGALLALYGKQASGVQSVKTIAWFKDGNLEQLLPAAVRECLIKAAAAYDPRTPPTARRSAQLD
jgi:Nucleotidyl transferase AbiEii toxin, Type IV TA system